METKFGPVSAKHGVYTFPEMMNTRTFGTARVKAANLEEALVLLERSVRAGGACFKR
jgi:hypothetical protein